MYAFVVFVGLALALAVVSGVLDEVLPIKAPRALSTTMTVVVAILVAWALDYSVFRAFGQSLRAEWMNPVATGIVLAPRRCGTRRRDRCATSLTDRACPGTSRVPGWAS